MHAEKGSYSFLLIEEDVDRGRKTLEVFSAKKVPPRQSPERGRKLISPFHYSILRRVLELIIGAPQSGRETFWHMLNQIRLDAQQVCLCLETPFKGLGIRVGS